MKFISLFEEQETTPSPIPDVRINVPVAFALDVVPPLIPLKGLLHSGIVHALLLAAALYLPWQPPLPEMNLKTPEQILQEEQKEIVYLPSVLEGGGQEGKSGLPKGPGKGPGQGVSARAAKNGFIHAGPQPIISDPPNPTNALQTIQRPDLVAPPKLTAPIQLPSMVVATSLPTQPTPGPELKQEPIPVTPAPVEEAKLIVPAETDQFTTVRPPEVKLTGPSSAPNLVAPKQMPILRPEVPTQSSKMALVLNAVAIPADPHAEVPNAEIAGRFAVMPSPPPPSNSEPGGLGSSRAGGVSLGTGSAGPSGVERPGAIGDGGGPSINGGGGGNGSGRSGNGSGSGTAGTGPGGGGTGSGTGRGAGSGTGTGTTPFKGISIIGGSQGGVRSGTPLKMTTGPRASYTGMMIVAGGSSGGALKDFGAFPSNATVYTVYISSAELGGGPDWPLQYALTEIPAATSGQKPLLSPPLAQEKFRPEFKLQGMKLSTDAKVVIAGTIGADGKMTSFRILRSPAPALSANALQALEKWHFRPAEIEGKPVAVTFLLGIPIAP